MIQDYLLHCSNALDTYGKYVFCTLATMKHFNDWLVINLRLEQFPKHPQTNILLGSNLFSTTCFATVAHYYHPWSFSVHLCAQLGHNFHWEPHQHISDNAMIDSGQYVHLKHSWNIYSIVYICIHTSSYKKHPWTIKKRNLSVDFMDGLQRFQPVFQHPVLCRPQRLLVWQGLPVEAVAPVVVPAVFAKHRTPLADPLVAGGMDASGANFFTHCVKVQSTSSVMTFRPRESNTLVAMLCYETNPLHSPFFKNTLWTLHESLWHMIPYGNLWTSLWVRLRQPWWRFCLPKHPQTNILLGSNLFSTTCFATVAHYYHPWSFSVHLCAQLGHNFHWEPHQHISDNAMIDSGQDVHLKHSWNIYSIVYICIHTSSYKKHPWSIKKRNLSVDFMDGLQRFQPVFQHPVLCRPQRLLVWQGLPVEAVAPVVVPAVFAKHRTPLADPLVAGGMEASGANFFTHCVKVQSTSSVMTFRPRESNTLVAMLCYETNPLRSPFFKNTLWTLHESLWHMIPYGNLWTSLWVRLRQPWWRFCLPKHPQTNILLGSNLFSTTCFATVAHYYHPWSFSVHLCAQLGHNFHWEPHQHISDNAMIDSGQDVHLKHSWNIYSIVYICIHTSSYKKHPWTIKKRNLSVDFMDGLQRFQPVFQHPVLCRPQRLMVWQGLPVEAVAPVVVPAVFAKHRTPLADPLVAGGMDASGANFFTHCVKVQSTSSVMTFRPRESNTLVAMLCYETNPLRSPFFKNTLWTLHESLWHMIPYGNLWTSLWVRLRQPWWRFCLPKHPQTNILLGSNLFSTTCFATIAHYGW